MRMKEKIKKIMTLDKKWMRRRKKKNDEEEMKKEKLEKEGKKQEYKERKGEGNMNNFLSDQLHSLASANL
jgi:hypothetical protein